ITMEQAQAVEEKHLRCGIKSISYCDKEYPDTFREICDAPVILFYKGDIAMLKEEFIVAIIGSRNPDRDGLQICENIAGRLAVNGVVIASGLAQGLDGTAHKAALELYGKTIAFVGTALDIAYPAAHKSLQNQIIADGCVISEYYIGVPTPATTFLERNRLIAACSRAVCVIQAKCRSGSLATARNALEYDKRLFAVPGTITNPMYDGTNHLIQEGATPLVKADDVLNFLGLYTAKKTRRIKPSVMLSEEEQAICICIGRQNKSTNQIFAQTQIPMVRLKALLTRLELDSVIASQSAGVYYIK
ncbi:MAG: DNA-processing protein DprA, partial [Oscillospiraceae bacterium]